jgi:hypothetical protein
MIDSEIMDMILKAVPTAIKNVKEGGDYELDVVNNPAAQKCPAVIKHWDKCDKASYETTGPGSAGCLGEGGQHCECFTRNDNGWNYYMCSLRSRQSDTANPFLSRVSSKERCYRSIPSN